MKAIGVDRQEGAAISPLVTLDLPTDLPQPGEVRIRVAAAGVNRADVMQREGRYPPPPGASPALGLELSGVVDAVGEGVDPSWVGQRVCALVPGGGYAEYACVPEGVLIAVPDGMSLEEAAGLPEVFLTAFSAVFDEGNLKAGERILIHAGASGVGTAAIQLAVAAGAEVFTTVGGPKKVEACQALGASLAMDRHTEDFETSIQAYLGDRVPKAHVGPGAISGPGGIDVIIDMVGKDYLERNLRLLNILGRLVIVSVLSGNRVDLDLLSLTSKRLSLIGMTLRARTWAEKADLTRRFVERFGPALQAGTIRPVIDRVLPWEQADDAHQQLLANANVGKVILRVADLANLELA